MAGNNAIQILRSSKDYDISTDDKNILLDGQPFYSKKTKKLYIGDGTSTLKNLEGTEIGLNLENGTEKGSLQQLSSDAQGQYSFAGGIESLANGTSSFAFGDHVFANADGQVVFGNLNKEDSSALFILGNGVWGNTNLNTTITYQNAFKIQTNNSIIAGDTQLEGLNDAWEPFESAAGYGPQIKSTNMPSSIIESQVGASSINIGRINYTEGTNCAVFGAYNTAFPYEYIQDNSGPISLGTNRVLISGYRNQVVGSESVALGDSNTVFGGQSTAIGYKNIIGNLKTKYKVDSAFVAGEYNRISPNNDTSTHKAEAAIVMGYNNGVYAGSVPVVVGVENTIENTSTGKDCYAPVALGQSNKIQHNNAVAIGKNLVSGCDNQILLGRYNKENKKAGLIFAFGDTDNSRKNILEFSSTSGNINVPLTGLSIGDSSQRVSSSWRSVYIGQDNSIGSAYNSLLVGASNRIGEDEAGKRFINNAVTLGKGLKNYTSNSTIVGRYNAPNSNALFQVGNGDSDLPSNAFEVLSEGGFNSYGNSIIAGDLRADLIENTTMIEIW